MKKIPDRFAFACPLHGYETQVFCHRAYAPENIHLWVRLETTAHELTDKDKDKIKVRMSIQ